MSVKDMRKMSISAIIKYITKNNAGKSSVNISINSDGRYNIYVSTHNGCSGRGHTSGKTLRLALLVTAKITDERNKDKGTNYQLT